MKQKLMVIVEEERAGKHFIKSKKKHNEKTSNLN